MTERGTICALMDESEVPRQRREDGICQSKKAAYAKQSHERVWQV